MSVNRATASVVVFPLIDSTARPARKSSAASIVTQLSKDGGAFAATTNSASEIATASGHYALTLTAAETAGASLLVLIVSATSCDPVTLLYPTYGLGDGIVTGSPTSTSITASAQAETATDHWKGAFLRFTTGALAGQVRQVTGYATGVFATAAFTAAPAVGDRYVIVNS